MAAPPISPFPNDDADRARADPRTAGAFVRGRPARAAATVARASPPRPDLAAHVAQLEARVARLESLIVETLGLLNEASTALAAEAGRSTRRRSALATADPVVH